MTTFDKTHWLAIGIAVLYFGAHIIIANIK